MFRKVILVSFIVLVFFSLSSLLAQTEQAGDKKVEESQVSSTVVKAKKVGAPRTVFQIKWKQAPIDPKNKAEKAQISQNADQPAQKIQDRELTKRELKKLEQIHKAQNKAVKATTKPSQRTK